MPSVGNYGHPVTRGSCSFWSLRQYPYTSARLSPASVHQVKVLQVAGPTAPFSLSNVLCTLNGRELGITLRPSLGRHVGGKYVALKWSHMAMPTDATGRCVPRTEGLLHSICEVVVGSSPTERLKGQMGCTAWAGANSYR